MKRLFNILTVVLLLPLCAYATHNPGKMKITNKTFTRVGDKLVVSADFVLDSLNLGADKQWLITPVIESGDETVELPVVLINGRNMHFAYERGTIKEYFKDYDIFKVIARQNGKLQTIPYAASTDLERWMLDPAATIHFEIDTCRCGANLGGLPIPPDTLNLNPAPKMYLSYITPPVTELPIIIHEGKARVQFEVDKTVLHDSIYKCRNGQIIDNRQQLNVIHDSIRYALRDPHVEIASINICGYASPESPYLHNQDLATDRSRALAEYLREKYRLPEECSTYSSVPENWSEFRDMVVAATDITPDQRRDLLELIDRPAYGASDYDKKEDELNSPKFRKLYRSKILPQWFPHLRATKFAISTRLKPLSDPELAEVLETTPEMMSLNQIFRVARLYPEGSEQFDRVIAKALEYYPNDPIANLNSAIEAIKSGHFEQAQLYLSRSGDSPQAENARGVLATYNNDFDTAMRHFQAAGDLPEAVKNRALLGN